MASAAGVDTRRRRSAGRLRRRGPAGNPNLPGLFSRTGQAVLPGPAGQGRDAGTESCTSCHTADPRAEGRHARTNKLILPLAPAANPERLTDRAQVEKWFKRNCNDVLSRACTAQEKGDVIAYLRTVR
ncbi:MAG: DUF1924 domain-containing protein [Thiobacillus sp.]|nr:DUF1924 domain-containing protein [Thiobacillus sp.]